MLWCMYFSSFSHSIQPLHQTDVVFITLSDIKPPRIPKPTTMLLGSEGKCGLLYMLGQSDWARGGRNEEWPPICIHISVISLSPPISEQLRNRRWNRLNWGQ
jgi:hypothetical protein